MRRRFIALGISAVLFFTPVASASGASSVSSLSWENDWKQVLEKVRQEDKVVVGVPLGEAYRKVVAAFQKAFPELKVEATSIHTRDFIIRIEQERRVGQYLWDAFIGGPDVDVYKLGQAGYWDPVKADLLLPEVLDDAKWRRGFEDGFSDSGKKFAYNFIKSASAGAFFVNRDFVPDAELPNVDGLWDPKWKGKIVWHDPRGSGAGVNAGLTVHIRYGEKALRDLFGNQKVVITHDQRQLIEWVVRGRYPIAGGLIERELKATFQSQGVGLNVQRIVIPNLITAIPGSNSVLVVQRAPHPNSRKVFVNWLLSREGQTVVVQEVKDNSRRTDVAVIDPETLAPEGKGQVINTQAEEYGPQRSRVNQISREIFQ